MIIKDINKNNIVNILYEIEKDDTEIYEINNIETKYITKIIDNIKKDNVKMLSLINIKMEDNIIYDLIDKINNIKILILKDINFKEKYIFLILTILKKYNIETLSLINITLNKKNIIYLNDYLQNNHNLKNLTLINNKINNNVDILLNNINNIENIILTNNNIDDNDCYLLYENLKNNLYLKQLFLNYNNITDYGFNFLIKLLLNHNLLELYLTYNNIKFENIDFYDFIDTKKIYLDLDYNLLTDIGFKNILKIYKLSNKFNINLKNNTLYKKYRCNINLFLYKHNFKNLIKKS